MICVTVQSVVLSCRDGTTPHMSSIAVNGMLGRKPKNNGYRNSMDFLYDHGRHYHLNDNGII